MAEESQAQAQEAEETTQTAEPTVDASQDAKPTPARTDWKAEARKWEARAKANSKAAEELETATRQAEESKTEAEKLAKQLDDIKAKAQQEEAQRKAETLRAETAARLGIPDTGILTGDTKESVEQSAERILKAFQTWQSRANVARQAARTASATGRKSNAQAFGDSLARILNH